jgi:hypothetical protein
MGFPPDHAGQLLDLGFDRPALDMGFSTDRPSNVASTPELDLGFPPDDTGPPLDLGFDRPALDMGSPHVSDIDRPSTVVPPPELNLGFPPDHDGQSLDLGFYRPAGKSGMSFEIDLLMFSIQPMIFNRNRGIWIWALGHIRCMIIGITHVGFIISLHYIVKCEFSGYSTGQ